MKIHLPAKLSTYFINADKAFVSKGLTFAKSI
jgi:hypothetical protein